MDVYGLNLLKEKIGIYVCTLNEEKNIEQCLKPWIEDGFKDITVIDAGEDNTQYLAKALGVRVIRTLIGLSVQRKRAFMDCKKEYALFLDADDRLESSSLELMYQELNINGWAAVVASKRVPQPHTYSQACMDAVLKYCISRPGVTKAIGGNALFRTHVMRDIQFGSLARGDDTQMSFHINNMGLVMGTSLGFCLYSWPPSLIEALYKFWYYGKGDCDTVLRYPKKYLSMVFHQIIRYPIIYSYILISKGMISCLPFVIAHGVVRCLSMHIEFFKKCFNG